MLQGGEGRDTDEDKGEDKAEDEDPGTPRIKLQLADA